MTLRACRWNTGGMGTRAQLRRAMRDQSVVRIARSPKYADDIEGFVVAVGQDWAVTHNLREGGYFDGYSAFPLKDVKRVHGRDGFSKRFAQTLSTWPPRCPDEVELDCAEAVVRSMAAHSALVGIEQERKRSAMWVGEVDQVTSTWTWLLEVRPDATWHSEPQGYKNKRITLVTIDSLYLRALSTVAGHSARPTSE